MKSPYHTSCFTTPLNQNPGIPGIIQRKVKVSHPIDAEREPRPSTELVSWFQFKAIEIFLNPATQAAIAKHREVAKRIEAGEMTAEEAFGPIHGHDEVLDLIDEFYGTQLERSYPLPEHLHWMGDGVHDNYRPPEKTTKS